MAHEVKIPAAGESINSASVGQWHKADGDAVQKGELLATIETDKVSTELEAEIAGTLKIVVPEGEEVAIGTLIAQIDEQAVAPADPPEPEPAAQAPDAESSPAAVSADGPGEPEVIEIKVPAAGESITSASIAQWHKRDGEVVAEGDTLVTLETDKVSAELDAEADGVLNILSAEGAEVVIGAVIGTLTVGEAPAPATEERAPVPIPDPAPPVETASPVPATAPARPSPAIGAAPEVATKLRPDLAVVPEHPRRESIPLPFSPPSMRWTCRPSCNFARQCRRASLRSMASSSASCRSS
jgi:2-oxoglutarate dehydrogenase E2 component (dihydrolipoamide succinyltransferase)